MSLLTSGCSFFRIPVPLDTLFRTCWICCFHVRPLSWKTPRNFASETYSICWPLDSIGNDLSIAMLEGKCVFCKQFSILFLGSRQSEKLRQLLVGNCSFITPTERCRLCNYNSWFVCLSVYNIMEEWISINFPKIVWISQKEQSEIPLGCCV